MRKQAIFVASSFFDNFNQTFNGKNLKFRQTVRNFVNRSPLTRLLTDEIPSNYLKFGPILNILLALSQQFQLSQFLQLNFFII